MPLLSVKECARLLGVHPKTLHQWLRQAHLPVQPHPTDGRVSCLTDEQAETIAALHARSFLPQAHAPEMTSEASPAVPSALAALPATLTSAEHPSSPPGPPAAAVREEDPMKQMAALLATVGMMQEQLTHLALALCSESFQRYDQRLSALEERLSEPSLSSSQHTAW